MPLRSRGAHRAQRQQAVREPAAFKALVDQESTNSGFQHVGGVKVDKIVDDSTPVRKVYSPGNPLADKDGYVYAPPIDQNAEMVDMLETSRQYQNNIEVLSTAKTLLIKTINVGK